MSQAREALLGYVAANGYFPCPASSTSSWSAYGWGLVVVAIGMSFGAISKPAVQAPSRGAALAGCWMDTGEGGLARPSRSYGPLSTFSAPTRSVATADRSR